MRRRLQSFSLAACKDKTSLKTTFYYDNVPGSNRMKASSCRLLVVPKTQNSTTSGCNLIVRMNWINEDDLDRVRNI